MLLQSLNPIFSKSGTLHLALLKSHLSMKNKRLKFSVIFGQCILHQLPLVIIAFVHQIIMGKEITVNFYTRSNATVVSCVQEYLYTPLTFCHTINIMLNAISIRGSD